MQFSKNKYNIFNLDKSIIFIKAEWKQRGNCMGAWGDTMGGEYQFPSFGKEVLFEDSRKSFQEDLSIPAECTVTVSPAWQEICFN